MSSMSGRSVAFLVCFAGLVCATQEEMPSELICDGVCTADKSFPTPVKLVPKAFNPLPTGSIAPKGWLLDQLLLQANSLSGYMSKSTFPGADRVNMSLWVGGNGSKQGGTTQWLPYWTNGNVPLVALIRAAGPDAVKKLNSDLQLANTIDSWMEFVLAHTNKSNGWIGPYLNEPGDGNGHGLWDPLNMIRSLLMHMEAKPKLAKQVAKATVAHLTQEYKLLTTDPVMKWAQTRWPTFVEICQYVVDNLVPKFGADSEVMPMGAAATTEMLLNASALFAAKGMDWEGYYHQTGGVKFPEKPVNSWNTNDHGVNNAEGALRWPAVTYRMTGNESDAAQMAFALSMLDKYQGQVQSFFSADEVFAGRGPNRGTETCAVVEMMASLSFAFQVLGGSRQHAEYNALMDRVERLAFNALPAALTADMWTHVYVQQANSVFAGRSSPKKALEGEADGAGCAVCGHSEHTNLKQGEDPSGEDQTANFFGVSHFPCCITNFPQGWPKFAMSAFVIEPADDADATGDSIVVASLIPASATLPTSVGGGGRIETESKYPFGDNATIKVSGTQSPTTVKVRVPEWATEATIDGKHAPNGTLVPVACPVDPAGCEIVVALNPQVRIEKGWGSFGTKAGAPIVYSAGGAAVPSAAAADWEFAGGAATSQGKPTCGQGTASPRCSYSYVPGAVTAGHDVKPASNMTTAQAQAACDAEPQCLAFTFSDPEHDPHVCDTSPCQIYLKAVSAVNMDPSWQTFLKTAPTDISTGRPGGVSSAIVGHPIAGDGHYITRVSMSFRYLAGYAPPKGQVKNASTLSINLLDAATGKPVTAAPIYTSPPLGNYSAGSFSPLQTVVVDGLKIENSKPVLLQLLFNNNQRNLAVQLNSSNGFNFKVSWSTDTGPVPPSPPSPYLTPPCNGAAITRGPLVFALHPKESKKIVTDYSVDLPARPKAVDYEISTNDTWNFALVLPDSSDAAVVPPTFDPTPSSGWSPSFPFDDSGEYPFSVKVQARTLAAWGYWKGSKITAVPPASPVKCSGSADCGSVTEVQLVPFGSTNIRVAVFPWLTGQA